VLELRLVEAVFLTLIVEDTTAAAGESFRSPLLFSARRIVLQACLGTDTHKKSSMNDLHVVSQAKPRMNLVLSFCPS
jgi:hypothetical protein